MPVFDPKICVYPDQAVQGSLAGKLPAFFCTVARLKGISHHSDERKFLFVFSGFITYIFLVLWRYSMGVVAWVLRNT